MKIEDLNLDTVTAAYREDPNSYKTIVELGLCLASIRKHQMKAEPFLLKALSFGRMDDYTQHILERLGAILGLKGNFEGAVDIYRSALKMIPQSIEFTFLLGDRLFQLGKLDEASHTWGYTTDFLFNRASEASQRRGEPTTHLLGQNKIICRYFGEMSQRLDMYIKARDLGWIDAERIILLAPPDQVVNPAFADYWADHVDLIRDPEEIAKIEKDYEENWVYMDYFRLPDKRVVHRMMAYHVAQAAWDAQGRAPLLELKEEHREKGWAVLEQQGMSRNDWFVCLHVREAGFFDEDVPWSPNYLRNCRIETYLSAIEEITSRGGWVVRIGDPSMTPLPKMDRVIDYPHAGIREDWLDVFLVAAARFYFGQLSGPNGLPINFGVPSLVSNCFPIGWWHPCAGDLIMPKLVRRREDGSIVPLAELMKPPLFATLEPAVFEQRGLEIVDNESEDLREAVVEMMDRLESKDIPPALSQMQARFKMIADPYGVGVQPDISDAFAQRHPGLLGET